MRGEELLYPPSRKSRAATPPVSAVRGFVFLSGQKWLAEHGLQERHQALMSPKLRALSVSATATDWIPLEDALGIYAACDALNLTVDQQIELGRHVSRANNGIVIRTMANLAGKMGISPWVALRSVDRLWLRNNRGGGVAVYKVSERSARLEFWNVPLARSPFFVTSMRGAIAVGMEDFCERILIVDLPELLTPDGFALRLVW